MASNQTDPNLNLNGTLTAVPTNPALTGSVSSGNLVFPLDLEQYPVWMTLAFSAYQVPSFYTNNPNGSHLQPTGNVIRLPLPNYMVDHQLVVYTQEELGLALGLGLNQYAAVGSQAQGQAGGAAAAIGAGAAAALLGSAASDLLAAGRDLAGAIPGINGTQAQSALENALGYTVNPFLTVMFRTPAYKKHTLSWKLSPKNETESIRIASIIDTLKFNELPDTVASGAGLAYPSVVHISASNAPTKYFNYVFKPAVIESCAVSYAPAGQPSFYTGTLAPGEVDISLSILEIELWLRKDYPQQ